MFLLSDHGFHFGQFGMPHDKRQPYDFDVRVPMAARGPRVERRATDRSLVVSTIDLAPTLLEIAGEDVPEDMDGKSLLGLISGEVWQIMLSAPKLQTLGNFPFGAMYFR